MRSCYCTRCLNWRYNWGIWMLNASVGNQIGVPTDPIHEFSRQWQAVCQRQESIETLAEFEARENG